MGRALIGNFKGPKGDPGEKGATGETGATGTRGTKWFSGTGITGTSTTATVFSGSGVTEAVVDDRYQNTSTGNVYRCVTGGNASVATWVYDSNIKGPRGEVSDCDTALSTTSTNPVQNKAITEELNKKLTTTGDASNTTATFSAASSVAAPATGEKLSTIFGKIAKAIADYISHKATAGTTSVLGHLKLGTAAGTACAGNDSRLSNARTPTAHNHAASEITSGTLPIARGGTGAATAAAARKALGVVDVVISSSTPSDTSALWVW